MPGPKAVRSIPEALPHEALPLVARAASNHGRPVAVDIRALMVDIYRASGKAARPEYLSARVKAINPEAQCYFDGVDREMNMHETVDWLEDHARQAQQKKDFANGSRPRKGGKDPFKGVPLYSVHFGGSWVQDLELDLRRNGGVINTHRFLGNHYGANSEGLELQWRRLEGHYAKYGIKLRRNKK